ncbi:MAG: hypothetical protein Ta2E_08890 [Mycoplasmoidaceae bacterium]|nr:MAG: hypothetical protein Ta2E_08890 [Mycoplasmoidaceae bacterium]
MAINSQLLFENLSQMEEIITKFGTVQEEFLEELFIKMKGYGEIGEFEDNYQEILNLEKVGEINWDVAKKLGKLEVRKLMLVWMNYEFAKARELRLEDGENNSYGFMKRSLELYCKLRYDPKPIGEVKKKENEEKRNDIIDRVMNDGVGTAWKSCS